VVCRQGGGSGALLRFDLSRFACRPRDHASRRTPSGPAGSVAVVEFTLFGQAFMAISAGPLDPFNHAVSFMVNCADQVEIDRYWSALLDGGAPEQCGWLRDRYGLSWQIVPNVLGNMMTDPDRAKAKRVTEAMLKMVKFDIAALERAYAG
jgi:predicted 3-demethylubiquinone-9 3-methyltransferase (glyoxalase superfamily)